MITQANDQTKSTNARRGFWHTLLATLFVVVGVLGSTAPAQAATADLQGDLINSNTVVYNTARTLTKQQSAATLHLTSSCSSNDGCNTTGGAAYSIGMVTAGGGAIASNFFWLGDNKAMTTSSGSTIITHRGAFYIRASISGFCGTNPGCGTWTWKGKLGYDL